MKVAVWKGKGKIDYEERERPRPGAGEALIATKSVGICGTDLHIYEGQYRTGKPPLVLGHEAAGVVAELGPGVRGIGVGDRVVVDPAICCGRCFYCRHGLYYQCDSRRIIGVDIDGAYAEYFVAPASNCYPLPAEVNWQEAALVDTLACVLNGMRKLSPLYGKTVAVLGSGPSGYFFVQSVKLGAASKVIFTGIGSEKLKLGKEMGADATIDVEQGPFLPKVLKETSGIGVDVAIEACGVPEALRDAVAITRKCGELLLYGVYGEPIDQVDLRSVQKKEVTVYGASGAAWTYSVAIELIASGRIKAAPLVTHTFSLEELKKAFEIMRTRKGYIKGVVLLG